MEWLEQNIDAYRIVSEILGQMRIAIREGLERVYGDTWYRDGLPEEVFQRLVSAKERERSIDWYEGQYQQIMDYADFIDLIEILEKNAEHFPKLMALAPSGALLQARFLELDVMRAKLARARPISETELSFLGTFHLRFRKAFTATPEAAPKNDVEEAIEPPEEKSEPRPARMPSPPEEKPVAPAPPRKTTSKPPPQEPVKPLPKSRPLGTSSTRVAKRRSDIDDEAPEQAPKRRAQSTDTTAAGRTPSLAENDNRETVANRFPPPDHEPEPDDASDVGDLEKHVGPKRLAEALEGDDHRTVLRELYREVTAIAEGVWTSDVTPAPLVWEQVTASDWYENNFSRLGLHPLSVFYEVTSNVERMMRAGGTKKDLQEFLKETNFAKTLLALRDMFQANNL